MDQDDLQDDFYGEEFEQEEEEFLEEITPQVDFTVSEFYSEAKDLAKHYIKQFFEDKMLYCGGKIPRSCLFSDNVVSMVLNFDICAGVDCAYAALEKTITQQEIKLAKITGEITSDIKLVNETLRLIARSGVPQQFAGGIMCLYLEFVEGIEFGK